MQAQHDTMAQLQQEISQVQYENEVLSRIEHQIKEYIEQMARDKLGWKEGETIFIEKMIEEDAGFYVGRGWTNSRRHCVGITTSVPL